MQIHFYGEARNRQHPTDLVFPLIRFTPAPDSPSPQIPPLPRFTPHARKYSFPGGGVDWAPSFAIKISSRARGRIYARLLFCPSGQATLTRSCRVRVERGQLQPPTQAALRVECALNAGSRSHRPRRHGAMRQIIVVMLLRLQR